MSQTNSPNYFALGRRFFGRWRLWVLEMVQRMCACVHPRGVSGVRRPFSQSPKQVPLLISALAEHHRYSHTHMGYSNASRMKISNHLAHPRQWAAACRNFGLSSLLTPQAVLEVIRTNFRHRIRDLNVIPRVELRSLLHRRNRFPAARFLALQ